VIERFRRAPRAPLAVAGILATPIFFVALMAFALLLDEPTSHVAKNGAEVLGDPLGSTVATIYLASFAVSLGLVLVGVFAMFLPGRVAGVVVSALAAIAAVVALLLPLGRWEDEHTARYPLGVDLIPKKSVEDLILRGEWEANAKQAAQEIGYWTIGLAVATIVLAVVLELRRRRGHVGPAVPPPPEVAAGEPQIVPQAHQLP
jgi:hypothetical protein